MRMNCFKKQTHAKHTTEQTAITNTEMNHKQLYGRNNKNQQVQKIYLKYYTYLYVQPQMKVVKCEM